MKINQTKKKDLEKKSLREAYLKTISQENKIKTKANCMQPMNPEKQQLHNKTLHKRLCPIINFSYSATYSVTNYDGVVDRKQTDQCRILWKTIEKKNQQNQNKRIKKKKALINKICAKLQKQMKCKFSKLSM